MQFKTRRSITIAQPQLPYTQHVQFALNSTPHYTPHHTSLLWALILAACGGGGGGGGAPVSTDQVSADSASTTPASTTPASADLDSTDPDSIDPASTDSVSATPDSTDPVSATPDSTDQVSAAPVSVATPVTQIPPTAPIVPVTAKTREVSGRVVDGPVEGADVYLDTNHNGRIDLADHLIGTTNARGHYIGKVPLHDLEHPLIVDLTDATDHGTNLNSTDDNQSFQQGELWRAPARSHMVTPLTEALVRIYGTTPTAEQKADYSESLGLERGIDVTRDDPFSVKDPEIQTRFLKLGVAASKVLGETNQDRDASDYLDKIIAEYSIIVDPTQSLAREVFENYPLNKAIYNLGDELGDELGNGNSFVLTAGYGDNALFRVDGAGKIWFTGGVGDGRYPIMDWEKPGDVNKDNIYDLRIEKRKSDGTIEIIDLALSVQDIVNEGLPKIISFPSLGNIDRAYLDTIIDDDARFLLSNRFAAMPETGPLIVTWSIRTLESPEFLYSPLTGEYFDTQQKLDVVRAKIEKAIAIVERSINVKFIEVADVSLKNDDNVTGQLRYLFGGLATDVPNRSAYSQSTLYSIIMRDHDTFFSDYIRAIAGALGLKYPLPNKGPFYDKEVSDGARDSMMAYGGRNNRESHLTPTDIKALQFFYGAPNTDFAGVESHYLARFEQDEITLTENISGPLRLGVITYQGDPRIVDIEPTVSYEYENQFEMRRAGDTWELWLKAGVGLNYEAHEPPYVSFRVLSENTSKINAVINIDLSSVFTPLPRGSAKNIRLDFDVFVTNVNEDPNGSIEIVGGQVDGDGYTASLGTVLTASHNLSDPDAKIRLTIEWLQAGSDTILASSHSYRPPSIGDYILRITSYDTMFKTQTIFTKTITIAAPDNSLPTVDTGPADGVTVNITENHPLTKLIYDDPREGGFALVPGVADNDLFRTDAEGRIWFIGRPGYSELDFENPVDVAYDGDPAGNNIYHIELIRNLGNGVTQTRKIQIDVSDILHERSELDPTLEFTHAVTGKTFKPYYGYVHDQEIFSFAPDDIPDAHRPTGIMAHIISGWAWAMPETGPRILTWSFEDGSDIERVRRNPFLFDGYELNLDKVATARAFLEKIFGIFEGIINVKFVEVAHTEGSIGMIPISIGPFTNNDYEKVQKFTVNDGGLVYLPPATIDASNPNEETKSIALIVIARYLGLKLVGSKSETGWLHDDDYVDRSNDDKLISDTRMNVFNLLGRHPMAHPTSTDIAALQLLYGAPGDDEGDLAELITTPIDWF